MGSKSLHFRRHTFSRSYGVKLPSSLTTFHPIALGYSPRPPESVCSTITKGAPHAAFLGSVGLPSVPCKHGPHHLSALRVVVCPYRVLTTQPTGLNTHNHAACWATLLRPRLLQRLPWWCRNINLLSIAYASRPRLRYRLTRGRIILSQETLGLRRPGFSPGLSLLMPA